MAETRKEWVAVVHGQHGTWKIAAPNAATMIGLLRDQTVGGNMIASVYERDATIYTYEERHAEFMKPLKARTAGLVR
jgi:hypothetical protein